MLNVGDVVEVKITNVNDGGLDVEVGPYKGTVRIIDIDWNTVGLIDRIYKEFKPFETVKVKVMAVQGSQFLASIRDLYPNKNPWDRPEIYSVGSKFTGQVKQITSFGYFLELDTGARALLKKTTEKSDLYSVGQSLDVVVNEVDPSLHKIIVDVN